MLISSKHYHLLKFVAITIGILSLLLACQIPSKPALNPTPNNNATNVSETTDLSWENEGGATSYDVYFCIDPDLSMSPEA
jgi:hypothetical protein